MAEKRFKFDVILEEDDFCNREEERKRIFSLMKRRGRLVLYSLRRMGKTSLVSVCSERFQKEFPKSFILYADFNEVASLEDVASRLRSHFELALKEQFPIKRVGFFLNSLLSRLKIGLPGGLELAIEKYAIMHAETYLLSLFQEIKKMSREFHVILIIDEFQGICALSGVQALLRREFQRLNQATIIIMGSNQRLLYKMFNDKKAPFFAFGEDLELKPISVKDYLPYMNERFEVSQLLITGETATYLMEKMNWIPNYINELCAWVVDSYRNVKLVQGHIDEALEAIVKSKSGRYESALFSYTANQKKFIRAVARLGGVKAYSGKEVQDETGLSATELVRVNTSLEAAPILSHDTANSLIIIDPFLRRFLEIMG